MPWPLPLLRCRPAPGLSPWLAGLALAVVTVGADAPAFRWRAAVDFTAVRAPEFAAPYVEHKDPDPSRHGLAVNPRQHRDRFAAAEIGFSGPAGQYTLELLAVAEEDGESVYRLAVNGVPLATRVNPATTEKRQPVMHRWNKVPLQPGDRLAVHFSGRSNGRIPEGEAFAWSRGRWRSLSASRETTQ